MKRMIVAVVTILMSGTSVMAQTPAPSLPTFKQSDLPAFNAKTVETFSGAVAATKGTGVRADLVMMLVSTAGGHRVVVLGPRRMLDPALINVAANTAVEVTASKVNPPGQPQPVYLAAIVKIGSKEYKLRNEQGRFITKGGTGADK